MGLSSSLAQFVVNTKYEDLPEEVIEFTKVCILDWLGSALAGADKAPIQMIKEMVTELGGEEQATLVTGGKSSVTNACLVNGAASHIVELDDIHKGSIIHAATVVIPAALAIAEWKKKSGKEFITAVAIGYDVCFRIGEAVSPSHYYYFHNTATCGTFGAAAAAAKLLDLTEEQIVHSLGSAGTQAAGLWEFIVDGAMSKQLHPAKAAMNGVLSALLSQKGFTSATKILEGDRGFFNAMSENYDNSRITDRLGEHYKIMENSFKIHASCRHTHHAVDLIQSLDLNPEKVEKIEVGTYQVALHITDNSNPETVYGAKFSLQYNTALALIKGKAGLREFTEENLWDADIRKAMNKVVVSVDPKIDSEYPEKWGARVKVTFIDQSTVERDTEFPKGDPENPATVEDLISKCKDLAPDALSAIDYVMNLEQKDNVLFLGLK
jgi:2-methylcitrate dehydratase PrpD